MKSMALAVILAITILGGCTTSTRQIASPIGTDPVRLGVVNHHLDNIIIPTISFDKASPHTVVKYLKRRASELDPESRSVSLFLTLERQKENESSRDAVDVEVDFLDEDKDDRSDDQTTGGPWITMDLHNVTLRYAFDELCRQADLWWYLDPEPKFTAEQWHPR